LEPRSGEGRNGRSQRATRHSRRSDRSARWRSSAGLDVDLRLWIILEEFNSDVIGRSFYLEPEPPIGRFSKAFFLPILREFIARRKTLTEVNRAR
jgi:hypothetical protein